MSTRASSITSSPPRTEFDRTSVPASSSAGSSPPPFELKAEEEEPEDEVVPDPETEKRLAHLEFVLTKSSIYANCLHEQMEKHKATQHTFIPKDATPKKAKAKKAGLSTRRVKGRKRVASDSDGSDEEEQPSKRLKVDAASGTEGEESAAAAAAGGVDVDEGGVVFQQPSLITGAKMKDYQLEGLQWMVALHQNGISGILADEMGLGKTLQTIAFSAYLRQVTVSPFLIVCPLSVLHNWVEEYAKFAPKIPVCMYHGSKADREELRRTVMNLDPTPSKPKPKGRPPKRGAKSKRGGHQTKPTQRDDEDEAEDTLNPLNNTFPVVVTTYEMIINDRKFLEKYDWGYIVVDEGHRLKNLDCKLMQEIKKYPSASRMILTGTPLHNNLAELWSLLNFVLPDIFNDIESFQEWFNLPTLQNSLPTSRSAQLISKLHTILKPFLLRRLKADVETNLPPKKEYVLYAPLTTRQREAYEEILQGGIRGYLMRTAKGRIEEEEKKKVKVDINAPRMLRTKKDTKGQYAVLDGDDDDYFDHLENEEDKKEETGNLEQIAKEHQRKTAMKQINNMKLQNTVMQLRKVCSHPFLFELPSEEQFQTDESYRDDLVNSSGKMMVLERLLNELRARGHRVLLFSQFTSMLDIIEDWATDVKEWDICRIDGKTSPQERRDQMNLYQNQKDLDRPWLFLLSTRAGGLGINLTAADTVIFYDQDWNPQMDAQAQDRAHRIGQTKPVLIFRLVSAHTIETKIMQKATEKRKLEALVIAKGKFKKPAGPAARSTKQTDSVADMASELLRLEGEKIDVVPSTAAGKASVLSDEDLNMLLDRRPEVFSDRGVGWKSSADSDVEVGGGLGAELPTTKKKPAFEVYTAPAEAGNELLAGMLGEEVV